MSATVSLDAQRLDEDGYVALRGLVAAQDVRAMRDRLTALLATTEQSHAGTLVVHNLLDDPLFDAAWLQPRVLEAVQHVLSGKGFLTGVSSRGIRPGHGQQALHVDWGGQGQPGVWYGCHAICALVDFTAKNGATRAVPGSHRNPWMLKGHKDPRKPHPAEKHLVGPAGTIFVLNIHCAHSATHNSSSEPRLAILSHFARRDSPLLHINPPAAPRAETLARLAPTIRKLLTP